MTAQSQNQRTVWESFNVEGGQLLDQFRKLIHEGNIRRIVISREGKPVAEFPLTVGVVGGALLPPLAAAGAIAVLIADCTIEVERDLTADVTAAPTDLTTTVPNDSEALHV